MRDIEPESDDLEDRPDWQPREWSPDSDSLEDTPLPERLNHIQSGPQLAQQFLDFIEAQGVTIPEDGDRALVIPSVMPEIHHNLKPQYTDPDSFMDTRFASPYIPINIIDRNRKPVASLICFQEHNTNRAVGPVDVIGANRWKLDETDESINKVSIMPPNETFSNAVGLALYYGSESGKSPSIFTAIFTPQSLSQALERSAALADEISQIKSIRGNKPINEVGIPSVIFASLFLTFQKAVDCESKQSKSPVGPFLGITHFTPPSRSNSNRFDFELGVAYCGDVSSTNSSGFYIPQILERRSIMQFSINPYGLGFAKVISSETRELKAA